MFSKLHFPQTSNEFSFKLPQLHSICQCNIIDARKHVRVHEDAHDILAKTAQKNNFSEKEYLLPLEDFETYSIRKYFVIDTDATFNIYI